MKKRSKKHKGIRVRELKDGSKVYDVLVTKDGKQLFLGTCDTLEQAQVRRHAYFAERAEEGVRVPRDSGLLTLRQLGVMALEGCPEWDHDRWRARVMDRAEFADWPAVEVATPDVQVWIDQMARTPIATGKNAGELPTRGTLASALALLRRVYGWAAKPARQYVTHNPCIGVTIGNSTDIRPRSKRNMFDYLRESEAKQLIDAPRNKLPLEPRTKFLLLMFAGPRPGDAWQLRWERVDWSAESIQFTSSKTSKEEARDYTVHMLPQLSAALREWWMAQGRPSTGLVFPSEEGRVYARGYDGGWSDKRERKHWKWKVGDEVRRNKAERVTVTKGYRTQIGIARPVPLYALRHTCACQLLLGSQLFTGGRQWSREEIQSQLGHADSKATERYLRALGILGRRAAIESREALKRNKGKT